MQDNRLIELHSHILPQLDDGSDSVEVSLAMLRREAEQGVGTVCATPHCYIKRNSIESFCEQRTAALEKLRAVWTEGLPQIVLAAEVAFFSGIGEYPSLERLCIQGTRTLLLEMPFTEWNDFQIGEISALVLDRGFHVVLVHPERFCFSELNMDLLERLAELPIGLQINTGSLIRWSTRKLALKLLQLAPYPLLGSDCHNLNRRPPNLKEGRTVVQKKLGWNFLRQMDQNAEETIQGLEWSI